MTTLPHPVSRPRRLRLTPALRRMVRETALSVDDFIQPLFIRPGENMRSPIGAMPGQAQLSIDQAVLDAREIASLGIPAVILFGIPEHKDARGGDNYDPHGIIPSAIRAIKASVPDLIVISDLCFCEYTDHGHCGLLNLPDTPEHDARQAEGYLLNDATLQLLGQAAVVHAEAGADIIAPSGMLDGMVAAIRGALDLAGLVNVSVLSYAAKFASAFYGPFREAAKSQPRFGDRRQYQMDAANRREAQKEIALDLAEGADLVMIKPALPYLDVISDTRLSTTVPVAAYQVSGEYSALQAAAQFGWLDLRASALESLTSIKRAGADLIVTYFARDAARWLHE